MYPEVTLHVPVIGKNGLLTDGGVWNVANKFHGVWNVANKFQHVNTHINAKARTLFDRHVEIDEKSAMLNCKTGHRNHTGRAAE